MEDSSLRRNERKRIAIIGGGVSSLMVLESLSKKFCKITAKPEITIFEKNTLLGRGLAYRTNVKSLILNTTIDTMSVCEYDKLDFYLWLQRSHKKESESNEIPRGVYGEYLEEKMSICLQKLSSLGCIVRKIKAEVKSVFVGNKYTLSFPGYSEEFDICIVATGAQVSTPDSIEDSVKDRLLSIFDEEKLSSIKEFSRIGILGSGQSAIDACIMLESYGLRGNYTLISRSGVLPRVKSTFIGENLMGVLNRLNIKNCSLIALCNEMLDSIKWKARQTGVIELTPASFRSMEVDLKRASRKQPSWQKIMIEITPFINELWSFLTDCEKRDFNNTWQKSMYYLRSAIMPESANRFLKIYKSGRVGMIWGNYKITFKDNIFQVSANNSLLNFDYVINTTGVKAYAHLELFDEAIKSGAVAINEQRGFRIEFESMSILNSSGNKNNGLYSLGYPTQGSVLISNSVELLRQKAVKIANKITENLEQGQL